MDWNSPSLESSISWRTVTVRLLSRQSGTAMLDGGLKDAPDLLTGGEKNALFFFLKMSFLEFHLVSRDDLGIFEDFGALLTHFWGVDAPATICPQMWTNWKNGSKNGHFLDQWVHIWHISPNNFWHKIFFKNA